MPLCAAPPPAAENSVSRPIDKQTYVELKYGVKYEERWNALGYLVRKKRRLSGGPFSDRQMEQPPREAAHSVRGDSSCGGGVAAVAITF